MTTKKVKRKNNITRKKLTSKSIPETITTVYHKLYSDIDNEKSLSCFLANNKIIKDFAFKIFYFMLSYFTASLTEICFLIYLKNLAF